MVDGNCRGLLVVGGTNNLDSNQNREPGGWEAGGKMCHCAVVVLCSGQAQFRTSNPLIPPGIASHLRQSYLIKCYCCTRKEHFNVDNT